MNMTKILILMKLTRCYEIQDLTFKKYVNYKHLQIYNIK